MDKSWMMLEDRTLPEYEGVQQFLDFAYSSIEPSKMIRCPCKKCNNVYYKTRDDVEADLYQYGILKDYVTWILHGEELDDSDQEIIVDEEENDDQLNIDEVTESHTRGTEHNYVEMQNLLEDCYTATRTNAWRGEEPIRNEGAVPTCESEKFMRLLRDADKELYPGCESFTKLSFTLTLFHIKIISRWSNRSFTMLLEVLQKALPNGKNLPCSYYEARKVIRDLGLDYEKIDACVNDCVLFRKEHEKEEECPKCSTPRYKLIEIGDEISRRKKCKKIPQKILRYFPLKPRLQRLFVSKTNAQDMRWHKEKRVDDGILRHPADGEEWKMFDKKHERFAHDPRNVRLGLASDGFNPFSNMSLSHSTWPVILLPYNLPPWKCLKAHFFILSMLIPGPTSPGNNIDIFLEPLIDELKELWSHGVDTYDASRDSTFSLRAALLWTINDFPAYGMLSGWSTKGYLACPICNKETSSQWLPNGKKLCYMGHRRFLPRNHKWRDHKNDFDGKKEKRDKPSLLTGEDVVEQLRHINPVTFGKTQSKKRKMSEELNWKKSSIFFELPYWKDLSLRHNLDVMHIEKNVCDNILGTLLDIDGKSKDNLKARLDLQAMNIRHQLHPKYTGKSYLVPPACYTLSLNEKRKLCSFLASVKYPDAYAANLSKRINITTCHIAGLKTHDCHIILQQLLPISIRGLLNDNVHEALHEFSNFFRQLCSKTLKKTDLEQLQDQISLTLCKLERIFPPSFFDIMIHLPVHLVREAILGGPEEFRWMFPVERYLCKLKRYVNNKAFPEGSMAEGYIAEECLTFCSMYMNDIETQFNKVERNFEGCKATSEQSLFVFSENIRLLGKGIYGYFDEKSLKQVHTYVLKNCDEVLEFISEHKEELRRNGCANVENEHEVSFTKWFEQRIMPSSSNENQLVGEDLVHLAYGPDQRVTHYEGCIVNGLRFHTKQYEMNKKSQNSGLVVKVDEELGLQDYYGVLKDIVRLDYLGNHQVTLFKYDWFEGKSVQKDKYNYISVNMSKPWKTNEPFVLATQAQQVFYVNDIKLGNDWKVVIHAHARSLWNVVENKPDEIIHIDEACQQDESHCTLNMFECSNDIIEWHRDDIPVSTIEVEKVRPVKENVDKFTNDQEDDADEESHGGDGDDDNESEEGSSDKNEDEFEIY